MMRLLLVLTSLFFALSANAQEAKLPADAESCLECHKAGGDGPAFDTAAWAKGIHAESGIGCTDCHKGYAMGPHDEEAVAGLSDADKATVAKLAAAKMEDVRFRDRLTRVEVELMALEITNLRFLDRMRRTGQPPGADVSMLKIRGTEIQQALTELAMQAADPAAAETQALERKYLDMRKTTIYAGSNEIQRNIIAKMTLGL